MGRMGTGLSDSERDNMVDWLQRMEEVSQLTYSCTEDEAMRAYQDGCALAYGDMREDFRGDGKVVRALQDRIAQADRMLTKAWSQEETDTCRGRLQAIQYVMDMVLATYGPNV